MYFISIYAAYKALERIRDKLIELKGLEVTRWSKKQELKSGPQVQFRADFLDASLLSKYEQV